jgi:VWFA-related protein
VDIYPTIDGRTVEGLTAADFEVLEDGTPQSVETFELIRHDTVVADVERRDPTSQADGDRQASDPHNRVFVVYLDYYHVEFASSSYAQSAVLAFLQRAIGPTDLFGVMTPEMPVGQLVFGRRMDVLEADLAELWKFTATPRSPRTPIEERLWGCSKDGDKLIPLHREELFSTSLVNLMHRLRDLRDERKSVLLISEGWVPRPPRPIATAGREGGGGIPIVGVGPTGRLGMGNQQPYSGGSDWCTQQEARLSNIDFEERFRELVRLAEQSNVTFYPVDVGGLRADPDLDPRDLRAKRNTLLTLSENTDGVAVANTNDTRTAARELADRLSTYYLLGYYSTNPAADGKFRRIEVRVKQPRVAVSARPGYFAPTAEMLAAASAPPPAGPTAVDDELARLARSRADTELFAHGTAGPTGVRVVAELASRLLTSGWSDGGQVEVRLTPATGEPFSATGRIDAGLRSMAVEIPAASAGTGPWRVAVRATSATRGRRAANAGPFDGSAEIAEPAGRLLGAPRAFRATPSARSTPRPVADFVYRRVERLHVEWPVLQTLDSREARLLDRQGEALPGTLVTSEVEASGGTAIAVDLTLSSLAAGDYVLELTAARGGESERKLLAFRLAR